MAVRKRTRTSFASAVRDQVLSWLVRDSGNGRARGVLRVWPLWERLARTIWPAVEIQGSQHKLVSMHFGTHSGDSFTLSDGTTVQHGDPVGEIHFNNRVFVEGLRGARGSQKWLSASMFRDELMALGHWMSRPDFPYPCKAIFGVSILSRGAVRLGFEMRQREKGFQRWLDRLFFNGLLILYGAEGKDRSALGRTMHGYPAEVWMSRGELLRQYASHPTA